MAERTTAGAIGAAPPTASRPDARGSDSAQNSPSGSSSPIDASDFHIDELLDALDGLKTQGSFASFRALPTMDPGVVVEDIGAIALPLQESQARQIIEKCRQAPCGKGEKTIVDTSIRNTWELDPSRFDLQNVPWRGLVTTMLSLVGQDLGIDAPIRAELYKMLVYETGAMFKPHTE